MGEQRLDLTQDAFGVLTTDGSQRLAVGRGLAGHQVEHAPAAVAGDGRVGIGTKLGIASDSQ